MNGTQPPSGPESAPPMIRTTQILVLAMIVGLLAFSAVVVGLKLSGNAPTPSMGRQETMFLGIVAAMTCASLVAAMFLRGAMIGSLRRRSDAGEVFDERALFSQFQQITILRAALAEGPALFATVVVLLSGNWLGFIGTAIGLAALLVVLPTRGKYHGFVRDVTGRTPAV